MKLFFSPALFVPVALLLSIFSSPALAQMNSSTVARLAPFKPTEVQDSTICQYTYDSQITGHSGLPPLFGNVSGIYISAISNFNGPTERSIEMVQPANLAILSACTVVKDTKGHIPVYLPQLSNSPMWKSFLNWPANREDGNIIVRVSADLQDKRSFHHGVSPGKLVIVKANFYRNDVNGSSNLGYQCAQAFQYTDDQEKLNILLTDAIHLCLDKPFYSMGR